MKKRIAELKQGKDVTLEINGPDSFKVLKENGEGIGFYITSNLKNISKANIFIVTVPTPVGKHKKPDLTPLIKASERVGKVLKKNDIVVYESTVYPGVAEVDCVPVSEKYYRLKYNEDCIGVDPYFLSEKAQEVNYHPGIISAGRKAVVWCLCSK
jgi:UDP-N-acetyl-D-galactosamine dehydrogenase